MTSRSTSNLVLAVFLLTVAMAAAKLVVAVITGSGAALAEFIHTIAAATGQGLMLVALRRAPNGRAEGPRALGDLRFWATVVPILIYSLGAGVALNEGTAWVQAPRALTELPTGLMILTALLFIQVAVAGATSRRRETATTVDQVVFNALEMQSLAALAGLVAVLGGLASAHAFGATESDAFGAVTIGLLMGGVAALMALETRKALLDATAGASSARGPVTDDGTSDRTLAAASHSAPPSVSQRRAKKRHR